MTYNRASFIDDSFQVIRRVTYGDYPNRVPDMVDLMIRGKVVTVPENAIVYLEFEEGDPNEPPDSCPGDRCEKCYPPIRDSQV